MTGCVNSNQVAVLAVSIEGTHKRTYRIRSKVHSELVLHIIVPTAYASTIFKKNKNYVYKKWVLNIKVYSQCHSQ